MVLVESCFCCRLAVASGFFAVYLLIAYLIAFAFELLWILESLVALPAAAVLLCAGYFAMALFAALLIHGLATKNTLCLIAWMFSVTILTFPEAGMVIYMSIQYWRIETLYGITELASWLVRILVNVVQLILIQSLYTSWKGEETLEKRLRHLNATAIPLSRESITSLSSQYYQNNAYDNTMEEINVGLKRSPSLPHIWNGSKPNNLTSLPFEGLQYCTTQSEFNASIFMPNFIGSDVSMSKKAQSMMDLRMLDGSQDSLSYPVIHQLTDGSSAVIPNYELNTCRMQKYASVDALNDVSKGHVIKNKTGFYAQPIANYGVPIYYGPLDGPDFLIYRKQVDKLSSKNSLSNASADDVQKYRDVAL